MVESGTCPMCNDPTEVKRLVGSISEYVCRRCGTYEMGDGAAASIRGNGDRWRLSVLTRRASVHGGKARILEEDMDSLIGEAPILTDPLDGVDRILQYIEIMQRGNIGKPVKIEPFKDYPVAGCRNENEFSYLMSLMEVQLCYTKIQASEGRVITAKGWERLNVLKRVSAKPFQGFVAMRIDDSVDCVWEKGICCALRETGYEPVRIDLKEHNEQITDEIIAEIRRSGLLVADFTGQRPNVYYEAGFAKGLGIPVIWLCDDSEKKELAFDTRQYNHILYKDVEDLYKRLRDRINATMPVRQSIK